MAEGARLESVFRGNSNVGSNPTLSASFAADPSAALGISAEGSRSRLYIKAVVRYPSFNDRPALFCPVRNYCLPKLLAVRLKTEILAKKRHHVILKADSHRTGVSAVILLEAIRDSVLIKHIVQLGGIDA